MINLHFSFLNVFGIEQTVLDNDLLQQNISRWRSNILSKTTIYVFSKFTESRIGKIMLQFLCFSLWPYEQPTLHLKTYDSSFLSKMNSMRNDLL